MEHRICGTCSSIYHWDPPKEDTEAVPCCMECEPECPLLSAGDLFRLLGDFLSHAEGRSIDDAPAVIIGLMKSLQNKIWTDLQEGPLTQE